MKKVTKLKERLAAVNAEVHQVKDRINEITKSLYNLDRLEYTKAKAKIAKLERQLTELNSRQFTLAQKIETERAITININRAGKNYGKAF